MERTVDVAVTQPQRARMLEAMLEELAEVSYDGISIEAVSRRAGVAPADFEAEFEGKDDCLFAAYDQLSSRAISLAQESCADEMSWPERIRAGLDAILGAIADRPDMARVATRVFPAIRPSAYERYSELLSAFVPFVREGRAYAPVEEELPEEVELLAIGAAESIIFSELDTGGAERLPGMLPEILFSLLVPFIGPQRAAEEMRKAAV